MEILNLGGGGMLLSLSPEDMEQYRFCADDGSAVRRLMSDMREKYGCRMPDGRLSVQMYESKSGGCELFVTKLDDRGGKTMTRQTDERTLTDYRRYILRERRGIYSFSGMNDLLFACRLLKKSGYVGKSEVYADRAQGKMYLVIDEESAYPSEALGTRCPSAVEYYLREHCTKIFGDRAAVLLGELV